MKKIIIILLAVASLPSLAQKKPSYDHVIAYSERFNGTRASYHSIIIDFALDSAICTYNAATHHADFFGNPADPSDRFVYDPRLQYFTADSVTFFLLYTVSLPVLEPLWTSDKGKYMPRDSSRLAFKSASYSPTLTVSSGSISAGGNSVAMPINTYTAGAGLIKTGIDPAAGFSADWTVVMSVSRANDSINAINAAMALKAPASRSITINGVSQDLSANRTWSIITPTYAAGSGISINTGTITNTSPDTWAAVASNYQTISASDGKYFLKPTGTTSQIILGNGTYTNYPTVPPATTITAGSNVSVTGSSGSYTVSAASPSASISGNTLTVGTSTVALPAGITYTAGTGISITSGVITNTAPNLTQSITVSAGNSNTITLSGAGGSVVLKGPRSYSGTTDASGNFTVTFATAYAVAPVVLPILPNQADKGMFAIVSSVSVTGFTVNVFTRATITSLPVIGTVVGLLGAATTSAPSINVDVIVTEK